MLFNTLFCWIQGLLSSSPSTKVLSAFVVYMTTSIAITPTVCPVYLTQDHKLTYLTIFLHFQCCGPYLGMTKFVHFKVKEGDLIVSISTLNHFAHSFSTWQPASTLDSGHIRPWYKNVNTNRNQKS